MDTPRGSWLDIAPRAGTYPALDGLRGIAILLVLLRHGTRPAWEETGQLLPVGGWDLAAPLLNGWMGVDLFFVLSGFLVSHHLLSHWPDRWSAGFFGRYWAKRVLRTFPAYYALVFLLAAAGFATGSLAGEAGLRELLKHLLFLQDYLGSLYVPAFWSLGVEEKFYLACPFVLLWLRPQPQRRQVAWLVALALLPLLLRAATLATGSADTSSYAGFFWSTRAPAHLAMDGLWLGVLCACIVHWRPDWARAPRLPARLATGGALLALAVWLPAAWMDEGHWAASVVVIHLVAVAAALVVLGSVLGPTPFTAFLGQRWLRWLGTASYSLYLVHLLVLPAALQTVDTLPAYADAAPWARALLLVPVYMAYALAAALLLHLAVEKPFLRLKDRIRL